MKDMNKEQRISRGEKFDQQVPVREIECRRQVNARLRIQAGLRNCRQWHRKEGLRLKIGGLLHVCIRGCYTANFSSSHEATQTRKTLNSEHQEQKDAGERE